MLLVMLSSSVDTEKHSGVNVAMAWGKEYNQETMIDMKLISAGKQSFNRAQSISTDCDDVIPIQNKRSIYS